MRVSVSQVCAAGHKCLDGAWRTAGAAARKATAGMEHIGDSGGVEDCIWGRFVSCVWLLPLEVQPFFCCFRDSDILLLRVPAAPTSPPRRCSAALPIPHTQEAPAATTAATAEGTPAQAAHQPPSAQARALKNSPTIYRETSATASVPSNNLGPHPIPCCCFYYCRFCWRWFRCCWCTSGV